MVQNMNRGNIGSCLIPSSGYFEIERNITCKMVWRREIKVSSIGTEPKPSGGILCREINGFSIGIVARKLTRDGVVVLTTKALIAAHRRYSREQAALFKIFHE